MLENNEVASVAMKRIYFHFVLFVGFFLFCFVLYILSIPCICACAMYTR